MGRYCWLSLLMLMILMGCAAAPNEPEVVPQSAESEIPPTQEPSVSEPLTVERPTLPPTWTPETMPTSTIPAFVTLTPDGTLDALRALPTFAACTTFAVDSSVTPQTFLHQQPVTVAWGAAEGASFYRISLFDLTGRAIFADSTRDTRYTFPAELFVFGNFYGWEVRPFDVNGIQYCMPIGSDLKGS